MNMRRKLMAAGAMGAVTRPLAVLAQSAPKGTGKVWRVGFLASPGRPADLKTHYYYAPFAKTMRELGYVEGKNLSVEFLFADNDIKRLPALAAHLVSAKVDVLVAIGSPSTSAAQQATATIPIVMAAVGDPVGSGFVKSLARPEANITGTSIITTELGPKRLEKLLEIVPKLTRVAILVNSVDPAGVKGLEVIEAVAKIRGITILPAHARTTQEIDNAFALMRKQKAGAVMILQQSLFQQQRRQIATLAAQLRLPSVAATGMYVEAGCLLSYGTDSLDNYRRVAIYVDKIIKGAKPADLPVEQPTKFEMVINGKTAKALGLKIPQSLLISADKVIE